MLALLLLSALVRAAELPLTLARFTAVGSVSPERRFIKLLAEPGGRSVLVWNGSLKGDFDAEAVIDLAASKIDSPRPALTFGVYAGDDEVTRGMNIELLPGPQGLQDGSVRESWGASRLPLKLAKSAVSLRISRRGDVFTAQAVPDRRPPMNLSRMDLAELKEARGKPVLIIILEIPGSSNAPAAEAGPEAREPGFYAVRSLTVRRP